MSVIYCFYFVCCFCFDDLFFALFFLFLELTLLCYLHYYNNKTKTLLTFILQQQLKVHCILLSTQVVSYFD